MRIRIPSRWETSGFANLFWMMSTVIMPTMRVKIVSDEIVRERLKAEQGQILVTWHGRTLLPLYHFRNKRFLAMISPSRDGDIMDKLFRRFGWTSVRGSTGRDALKACIGCVRRLQTGSTLAMTPDGPKGPPGVVQAGVIYMARKAGVPIIPAGVSAHPGWRMPSWDQFLLPLPFCRGAIVFGEPLYVPAHAGEQEQEDISLRLRDTIDELERQADALTGAAPRNVARV